MYDDQESLLTTKDPVPDEQTIDRRTTRKSWLVFTFCNTLIMCTSLVSIFRTKTWGPDDIACTRQLSTYSPALPIVEYYDHEFTNGFHDKDDYRGFPTKEKDAAWLALWSMGDIIVPDSKLAQLNKTDEATRRKSKPELGGVAANLEVFHQLHCLDIIRRYTWLDVYAPSELPPDFQDADAESIRTHVDHCITTLRESIMCTSDVTPVLLERDVENPLDVKADFHTLHKCRDFHKLQAWYIEASYTDWGCIQNGGVGCDVVPRKYQLRV